MRSGIEKLREEKYRFTIESQGLMYTSKHRSLSTKDVDTGWSEDDGERDVVPKKKTSPLAQRMATELTRVLQEGGSHGFSDDTLERLLVGSLQSSSDVAGYDVAKDYIKQVLDQLYGQDSTTSNKSGTPGIKNKRVTTQAPANPPDMRNRNLSSMESTSSGSLAPPGPGPSLPNPTHVAAQTSTKDLMAPPWTVTVARGSSPGAGGVGAPAMRGTDDDELERPRPRPHHGRIKEQLDLLQNADQLAAIISVATTAATTAAAAAVKQNMQAPQHLPPGAYARMHAAGESMYGLPIATAIGGQAVHAAQRQELGPDVARHAAAGVNGGESPDPQPHQRHGTLISPHRRSTPMFISRRQEADASAAGRAHGSSGGGREQGENEVAGRPGPESWGGEVQFRRHRLRWSQRRGVPLGVSPVAAADGGQGAASSEEPSSVSIAGTGSSNVRVVQLGTPRVTTRTPTPVRVGPPAELESCSQRQLRTDLDAKENTEPCRDGLTGTLVSFGEEGAAAGSSGRDAIETQHTGRPARLEGHLGSGTQALTSIGTSVVVVAPEFPPLVRPELDRVPRNEDISTIDYKMQQQLANAAFAAGDMPSEGFFVIGGESVFTRAPAATGLPGRQSDASGMSAKAADLGPPQSRRSALPDDVQDAFRSTRAFISDPDGARAQQHQTPSWTAMEDVEQRRQAQREAEELLGGAFDYTGMKLELDRARRTSRLLQQALGPAGPLTRARAAAGAGVEPNAAGGQPRSIRATAVRAGLVADTALQTRGDYTGLLPPPHSVWDLDEAWSDLDKFSKAVEAEVAYRAAAVAPAQRVSPGTKQTGLSTTAAALTAAPGQLANAGKKGRRLLAGAAISTATATAPTAGARQEQPDAAGTKAGRKRTVSPRPLTAAPASSAAGMETLPSPQRALRKTQAQGPVRIAFGRRVGEPSKASEVGTLRPRSGSPPKTRGSPVRARSRARKVGSMTATAAAESAAPPSPSSTGDAVCQVLSALASVLLSDGEEAEAEGVDRDDPNGGVLDATGVSRCLLPTMADSATHNGPVMTDSQAGPHTSLANTPGADCVARAAMQAPPWSAAPAALAPLSEEAQLPEKPVGPGSEQFGYPADPVGAHGRGPESTRNVVRTTNAAMGAAGSSASPAMPLVLKVGAQPWPNTVIASKPHFQYVIDTAHPPITRLPAWAASARTTEGAPAAYAAVLGVAPTGLGFNTPSRWRSPQPIVAPMPFPVPGSQNASVPRQASNLSEAHPSHLTGGGDSIISATKTTYAHFRQQQEVQPPQQQRLQQAPKQLLFPAPGDLPSNTHILPSEAAAAVATATIAADGRSVLELDQQWEKAVLQAVEEEVVSRLAVVQLAVQGQDPVVNPRDLAGMLPPLFDMELSYRLVRDVLRDNLRSLLVSYQQQQGASLAPETTGAPTIGELVAALAAVQALPTVRLEQSLGQLETAGPGAAEQGEPIAVPTALPGIIDDNGVASGFGAVLDSAISFGSSGPEAPRTELTGNFSQDVGPHNELHDIEDAGNKGRQSAANFGTTASTGGNDEDSSNPRAVELAGTPRAWQSVYAGRRTHQPSHAAQAESEVGPAAVQAYDEDPGVLMHLPEASPDAQPVRGYASAPQVQTMGQDIAVAPLQANEAIVTLPTEPAAQTQSSLIQAAATAGTQLQRPTNPKVGSLLTTLPPRSPVGPGMSALASVSPPSSTTAVGVGTNVQHAMSDLNFSTSWQVQGAPTLRGSGASSSSTEQLSPSKSQDTQAHGMHEHNVQAHGAEGRGIQAYGIVDGRAVQAHGMQARGTQAVGVQERATQAAGVMDRSSQADPPLPHYLIQAAMAAGLSYGAGPPLLNNLVVTKGRGIGQPILAPDGADLSMPRPFYLVPAENSQLLSTIGMQGPVSGFTFPLYNRGDVNRPPLNLPGLSKMRDSSDVDSSTDSMGRNFQAPGLRTRAAALEALRLASRDSLDSDDGLLQRSYTQLELASLTARPVRLDQHRISSEQLQRWQPPAPELGQARAEVARYESSERISGSGRRGVEASGNGETGALAGAHTSRSSGVNAMKVALGTDLADSGPSCSGGDVQPSTYLTHTSASILSDPSAHEQRDGSFVGHASESLEQEVLPGYDGAADGTAIEQFTSSSSRTSSNMTSVDGSGNPAAPSSAIDGSGIGSAPSRSGLSDRSFEHGSVASTHASSGRHDGLPEAAAITGLTDSGTALGTAGTHLSDGAQTGNPEETSPVVGWTPRSDEHISAGGRYSSGAGDVLEFALSDGELLDETEVERVLEEEDAREVKGGLEDVGEHDDELRPMEGQTITLEVSSLKDDIRLSQKPSQAEAHGSRPSESLVSKTNKDRSPAAYYSTGKPPSLANYQGPTRQLWRPPSVQDAPDPLLSSSETLVASSEASGPYFDSPSRTLLNAQRRTHRLEPVSGLVLAVQRTEAVDMGDESSVDISIRVDSHHLGRVATSMAVATQLHCQRSGECSPECDSDAESDEEGQVTGHVQQALTNLSMDTAGLDRGFPSGCGGSRRDGAVFRLRQFGARRRKLMQQIGIHDSLLMSSASTVSTDSSTVSESIGDEGPPILRGGLRAATRRM